MKNQLSMKHYIFLLLCFFLLSTQSQAQRWKRDRNHISIGLGASGFMGDLGGADRIGSQGPRDYDFSATRPAVMLGYRYRILENLYITAEGTFGYVSGDDSNTNEQFRNNRNIHFRSPIIETSSTIQYYVLSFRHEGARYRSITGARGIFSNFDIGAYLFAGIGGFYFNPQARFDPTNYQGSIDAELLPSSGWYNLKPLNTEGQGYFPTRNTYKNIAMAIPFGFGVMFNLSRDFSVGIEYGFRKTFTDYIDDVSTTYVDPAIYSQMFTDPRTIALAEYFANPTLNTLGSNVTAPGQQRGNPHNTDAYMFTWVKLYYRLPQFRPAYGLPRF